jgi:PAS domain S-box-containing protein/putative nucleotidyltransferase with HDIG domain
MKKNSGEVCKNKTGSQDTASMGKQVEESQRENAEKYRDIIENIHDGCFEVDLAGNFTFYNDSVCRVLGYTKAELGGMNSRQFTDKDDVKKVFQAYNKVYKTGKPLKAFAWRIKKKDGSIRYIEGSISLRRDSSGKPIGFLGIANDITERIRAEEKLRAEEQRFRTLAEQSSDIILVVSNKGIILYENPAVDRILGLKREERVGKSVFENLHPDDLNLVTNAFNTLIGDKNALAQKDEIRIRHSDGNWRTCEVVASNLTQNDVVEAIIINLRDITERKQAEDALEIANKQLKDIIEFLPDATVVADQDNKIIAWNRAMEELTGVSKAAMIGQDYHQTTIPFYGDLRPFLMDLVCVDDKEIASRYSSVRRIGATVYAEAFTPKLYHNRGAHVFAAASPLHNGAGKIVGIIESIRDVTELKQAEEKYRNIFENAQEGIYQTTPDGRFITANRSMARILGYDSPKDLITGITDVARQLYVDPEERTKFMEMMKQQGSTKNYEVRFYRKDGDIIWVSLTTLAIRDEKGQVLYYEGIIENITDRKESFDRLRNALGGTVRAIASMVETKDPYTADHQRLVGDLARAIATEMGLSNDQVEGLSVAAIIHDIGKVSVPAEILSKPTKLTDLEFSLIKTHVQAGYDILKDIDFPWPVARMVLEHHERINGSGYPQKIRGEDILLEARILAVADVVDAMSSHRPYRPTLGVDAALEEIEKNKGTLYDCAVAETCLKLFREKGYLLK